MKKLDFFASSLTSKLKLKAPYGFEPNYKESTGEDRIVFLTGDLYADIENNTFKEEFIPIIRDLKDLSKECVQADYNDGMPFIPIVELAKLEGFTSTLTVEVLEDDTREVVGCAVKDRFNSQLLIYSHDSGFSLWHKLRTETEPRVTILDTNQLVFFQCMWRWHFAPCLNKEVKVLYVTSEFNPYK